MRKGNLIALLAMLLFSIALPCSIAYASNVSNNSYAAGQLQNYISGYKIDYQDYGFSSQSDMENSKLGAPVHLYAFNQTGVQNYVYGDDLPLVDDQDWLYPVYGGNNQIESTITISVDSNGKQYSVFGGYAAAYLQDLFQKYNELTKQVDISSLKVILEPNISTIFFEYKQNGTDFTLPYTFNTNDQSYKNYFQNKTVQDTSSIGQNLKTIQDNYENTMNNLRKNHPNEVLYGGGGIGVPPTPNKQNATFSLWVLLAPLGVAACAICPIRRKRRLSVKCK